VSSQEAISSGLVGFGAEPALATAFGAASTVFWASSIACAASGASCFSRAFSALATSASSFAGLGANFDVRASLASAVFASMEACFASMVREAWETMSPMTEPP
jgi:hypothetical protein